MTTEISPENRVEFIQYKEMPYYCHPFGSKNLTVPSENLPNWFWRKMQYLFFGTVWRNT